LLLCNAGTQILPIESTNFQDLRLLPEEEEEEDEEEEEEEEESICAESEAAKEADMSCKRGLSGEIANRK
jgi:hypothetical protein